MSEGRLDRGARLGPYEVEALLGMGGMGEVYRARDPRLGREVAIKVIRRDAAGADAARRFEREARAVAALSHPNVLAIHDVGAEDGQVYAVMELLEGETLRQRLARGPLPWRKAAEIGAAIADGVAAAHARGIVHRDLKPGNVFLTSEGRVKVLDFGLARHGETAADDDSDWPTRSETAPGRLVGTVGYMSPEQVGGKPVDARSDVFALGCVLFEMLAGARPFARPTAPETMAAILKDEPPELPPVAAVPPGLARLLGQCLEKDRQARLQSARDLALALRALTEAAPAEHASGRAWRRRPRQGWATALAAVVAAAAISTVAVLSTGRAPAPAPSPPLGAEIRSIAVLPFRSIDQAGENYVGLGLANDVITQVSQIGGVTVRPTSAVRRYADQEVDAFEAARQLQVDAVVDGTWQRSANRQRVSVNLLRVRDGASLWAESFDSSETDIFAIQDEVAREVASRLKLELRANAQARLARRHTSNAEAYEYYTKAMYLFADRNPWRREAADRTISLLERAIVLDPNYALAHAQLGYALAWTAVEHDYDPVLIERARQEVATAERLHPQLPETHVAKSFILFSPYDGWQAAAAIRELRLAQQLDASVGHGDLSNLYFHVGLDERMVEEHRLALEVDPTNEHFKRLFVRQLFLSARPDEARATARKLEVHGEEARYYLDRGMPRQAEPLIDKGLRATPADPSFRVHRARLLALYGRHEEARALVPWILEAAPPHRRWYHHVTYDIARVHALGGRSAEAVKWLRVTATGGFPCYTLFLRDSFLDPIRQDPAFQQFMAETRMTWERHRQVAG